MYTIEITTKNGDRITWTNGGFGFTAEETATKIEQIKNRKSVESYEVKKMK